jgi:methylmalonyl-CoA mutase
LDFLDFTPLDQKQWKQKIQMDLNGLDYNSSLIWESPEGIAVQPFYNKNTTEKTLYLEGLPEVWHHCALIYMGDLKIVNPLIENRIKKGIESFYLVCDELFDPEEFCPNTSLQGIHLMFETDFLNGSWLEQCQQKLCARGARVYLNQDPLYLLAKNGNWPASSDKVFKSIYRLISQSKTANVLGINARLYCESGANMVQQLAYTIAQANEALEQLRNHGKLPDQMALTYTLGLGPNYFFEMAKLRALRALNQGLADLHGIKLTCRIIAMPAKRFMTVYDFNNNLLRSTSSMMSGILGGADFLCNLPYDEHYKKGHEFSQGLAQNQLFILEFESLKQIDASVCDGAYYVESISHSMAEKALALFKEIEGTGGWLKAIKKGTIQRKIKESHQKAEQALNDKKRIVVGVNQFQDDKQVMSKHIELYPFQKMKPRKTLVAPIVERRLTQNIESQRLNDEKTH